MASLPIITVQGGSMPEAWENAYLSLAGLGLVYKRGDPDDPDKQIDSVAIIAVNNPDSDPFSHRKGGTNAILDPLYDYLLEMMGARDSWIRDHNNPDDTRWEYTYSERLSNHPAESINQIQFAKNTIVAMPFSRRINLDIWYAPRDTISRHTPCLQRIWFAIIPGQNGENDTMEMHYIFRSNNVVNASFANMLGLYIVGCDVRDFAEQQLGRKLDMRMVHMADSFHVNSRDYQRLFLPIVANIKESIAKGDKIESRSVVRADAVGGMLEVRGKVEDTLLSQTAKNYSGDLDAERQRVHKIGNRIFFLLEKYALK